MITQSFYRNEGGDNLQGNLFGDSEMCCRGRHPSELWSARYNAISLLQVIYMH